MHASAVQVNGGGLIFLGRSGAGKSTICRLLSTFAEPMADDRVFLIPEGETRWAVTDATEHILSRVLLEEEAAELSGVPLKGIFRLHQSSKPHLERTDDLRTCYNLTMSFFEFYWHRDLEPEKKKHIFSILAGIGQVVPGYELHFDLSPETVYLIQKVVV